MNAPMPLQPATQGARNLRTGLILGGIALTFFIAMFVRMIYIGR